MPFVCPSLLRRLAMILTVGSSLSGIAQISPIFPVLTFEPYAVTNAVPMADGDVNGDGAVDTAYVAVTAGSPAASTLTIALGSKTGGAATLATAVQVACTVRSVVLADLNKDSKLDAVATCSEGTVAVLEGNGDGSFQAASTYTVANAVQAAVGDFNGDGYPDLAVAVNTGTVSATFAVLLNKGSSSGIGLNTATVYNGEVGSLIYVADLDGDGKLDIAAGGGVDTSRGGALSPVYVYKGKGDGTFAGTTSGYGINGSNGSNLALGDFDGDGTTDVAEITPDQLLGAPSGVKVSLALGTKGSSSVSLPFGKSTGHVLDVNGDGKADLVLTGSTTIVLLGDGRGGLSAGREYATPGTFYSAGKGSDGKPKLVFATPRGFYTLAGKGDGTFDGLPAEHLRYGFSVQGATPGDFNADGVADIASPAVSLGRGDGSFLPSFSSGLANLSVVVGDFNGDGTQDIVDIYGSTGGPYINVSLLWLKGTGDGSFATGTSAVDLGVKGTPRGVAGDFDGDGKQDVVASYTDTNGPSGLLLLKGNGDGTFVKPTAPWMTTAANVSGSPIAGDLNGDGRPDVVWGDTVYLNPAGAPGSLALPVHGTALTIGDVNGDGVADVVIGNSVYAGNGDGTFSASPLYTVTTPAGSTIVSAGIADLNGDGNVDLVVQYMADMAGVAVAYGDSHGGFTADLHTYVTGSILPVGAFPVRLNNQGPALLADNRLDYALLADGAVVSLLNQTNPVPTAPTPLPTTVTLTASQTSWYPTGGIAMTTQVKGTAPTGTVTLTTADGTVVGTYSPSIFAPAPINIAFATAGTYVVTAKYSGDVNNAPSVSGSVTITIAKQQSTTTILAPPGGYRTSVLSAITAAVSSYTRGGQVTFNLNGQIVGTTTLNGAQAFVNYRFTNPGTYQLAASYAGDDADLPSVSQPLTVTVVPGPAFTLSASPTSNTVKAGATATYTITATPSNGYTGTIWLNCQGCSGNGIPLSVPTSDPSSIKVVLTAPTSTQNTGPRALGAGAAQAMLLMVAVLGRRKGRSLQQWPLALVWFVALGAGIGALSGCSSKTSSDTAASQTPVTYNVVIVGTDNGLGITNNVTLQLNVTP